VTASIIPFPEKIKKLKKKKKAEIKRGDENLIKSEPPLSADKIITTNLDDIMSLMMSHLENKGFQVTDKNLKELGLVYESVKSFLYKYFDKEHPLQQVSKGMFTILDANSVAVDEDKIDDPA
jgi:hypothetical protein